MKQNNSKTQKAFAPEWPTAFREFLKGWETGWTATTEDQPPTGRSTHWQAGWERAQGGAEKGGNRQGGFSLLGWAMLGGLGRDDSGDDLNPPGGMEYLEGWMEGWSDLSDSGIFLPDWGFVPADRAHNGRVWWQGKYWWAGYKAGRKHYVMSAENLYGATVPDFDIDPEWIYNPGHLPPGVDIPFGTLRELGKHIIQREWVESDSRLGLRETIKMLKDLVALAENRQHQDRLYLDAETLVSLTAAGTAVKIGTPSDAPTKRVEARGTPWRWSGNSDDTGLTIQAWTNGTKNWYRVVRTGWLKKQMTDQNEHNHQAINRILETRFSEYGDAEKQSLTIRELLTVEQPTLSG